MSNLSHHAANRTRREDAVQEPRAQRSKYRCVLQRTRHSGPVYAEFPWDANGLKQASSKMLELINNGKSCTAVKIRNDDNRECGAYSNSAEFSHMVREFERLNG